MNQDLECLRAGKNWTGLKTLPDGWQSLFRRMYAPKTPDADIETVVAGMPADKLDWALTQVRNSQKKLKIDR